MAVLDIHNLVVGLSAEGRSLVRGVSFSVPEKGCVGLVGESGGGKSLTCRAVLGALGPGLAASGRVVFGGRDILGLDDAAMRGIRGTGLGMIVQNAMGAFNPLFRIGAQMTETIRAHFPLDAAQARAQARAALLRMRFPDPDDTMAKYPHQLSGGMAQRVMCGLALALRPALLIADEPTASLDGVTRDGIVDVLAELRRSEGMGLLVVSHDLAVVQKLADHVVVLRGGEVVEQGPAREIFLRPRHLYTRRLVAAHGKLGRSLAEALSPREAM